MAASTTTSSLAVVGASSVTAPTAPPSLVTTFAPSPYCTVDIYRLNYTDLECFDSGGEQFTCHYYRLGPLASTSACHPPGWRPETRFYFSPGVCPDGYEATCSTVVELGSMTETRATCCPQGFGCQTENNYPWYTTDICTVVDGASGEFVYTTSTPGLGWTTKTETGPYLFNAYGVEIRWRPENLAPGATSTSSSFTSCVLFLLHS